MLYIYENFNDFNDNYKYWANIYPTSFAFSPSELTSFSDSDGAVLIEHKNRKYLAIEKEYIMSDEKAIKYFFNDAQFYSEAFPKHDIVCAPFALPEGFEPNKGLISLLIPIDDKRKKVLKTINWFNKIHTPG